MCWVYPDIQSKVQKRLIGFTTRARKVEKKLWRREGERMNTGFEKPAKTHKGAGYGDEGFWEEERKMGKRGKVKGEEVVENSCAIA